MVGVELPVRRENTWSDRIRIPLGIAIVGVLGWMAVKLGKTVWQMPARLASEALLAIWASAVAPLAAAVILARRYWRVSRVDVSEDGVMVRAVTGRVRSTPWSEVRSARFSGTMVTLALPGLGRVGLTSRSYENPPALLDLIYSGMPWDRVSGDPAAMLTDHRRGSRGGTP